MHTIIKHKHWKILHILCGSLVLGCPVFKQFLVVKVLCRSNTVKVIWRVSSFAGD